MFLPQSEKSAECRAAALGGRGGPRPYTRHSAPGTAFAHTEVGSESLARKSLPARCNVRRRRHEFLRFFRTCRALGTLPVRRTRKSNVRRSPGNDGIHLARISSERPTWPAIWISRSRTPRSRAGRALQFGEATPRSVRQSGRRRSEVE